MTDIKKGTFGIRFSVAFFCDICTAFIREGGAISLFISLVAKIFWLNNLRDFNWILIGWFISWVSNRYNHKLQSENLLENVLNCFRFNSSSKAVDQNDDQFILANICKSWSLNPASCLSFATQDWHFFYYRILYREIMDNHQIQLPAKFLLASSIIWQLIFIENYLIC